MWGRSSKGRHVKKDVLYLSLAAVAVGMICFGVTTLYPQKPPAATPPSVAKPGGPTATTATTTTTAVGSGAARAVIHVNGDPITVGELQTAFSALPEQTQQQLASEQGKRAFAEQLVRMKLLEQEGSRMGIDKDPAVAERVREARSQIIANAALQKLVADAPDAKMREEYEKNRKQFEVVQLRHILIAYEGGSAPPRSGNPMPVAVAMKKAASLVLRLRGGADFAQVATAESDDVNSAPRGGQLGPVKRGMLPPEIEFVIFGLKDGQISDPVRSQFGVHIFQVTSRKTQSFEEARQGLSAQSQRERLTAVVESLRTRARVDFDPKFFPPAPAVKAPGPGSRP
jgi:peptidyl-prolyl cis-trans isomerase C